MKKGGVARLLFCFLIFPVSLLASNPCAASDPFPTFPSLEPNVRFWIDTYTKYPTTTGIIHDAQDLNIVYGVIDLLPQDKVGARHANQERIDAAKEQYKKILEELAENLDPEDAEKWQFTPATGKKYLTVNKFVDERRDPIRASEAAAKLLKHNHERLGNWPMAVTAYNHGTPGVLRAKEQRGTYESVFENYKGPLFKFASRNFYSEFLAARHVAKNHTQYFSAIRLTRSQESREVVTKGQTSVAELSRHYDVDLETLRALNPALGQPVFKGQRQVPKGYMLRLPADSAKGVKVSSAALPQIHPDLRQ